MERVEDSVERVVQAIRVHPEFHQVRITVSQAGSSAGWFDSKKLERALYNLLLNACEAVVPEAGSIKVTLNEVRGRGRDSGYATTDAAFRS